MLSHSLGNDVVDFDDPHSQQQHRSIRFQARVLSPVEQALMARHPLAHRLLWCLWAAKEAAYKALARIEPALVFHPSEWSVDEATAAQLLGSLLGEVMGQLCYRHWRFSVYWQCTPCRVHACAQWAHTASQWLDWSSSELLLGCSAVADEAAALSGLGRAACVRAVASHYQLPDKALSIQRRPAASGRPVPFMMYSGAPLTSILLSLSHDHRFVAYAAYAPVDCPGMAGF